MSALREILNRYIGRCVAVHSYGYRRFIGKVVAVTDEFLVLKNATVLDDLDSSRWEDDALHNRVMEDVDTGFAETVLSLTSIVSVTSSDNDGLLPIEKLVEDDEEVPQSSLREQAAAQQLQEAQYDAIELQLGLSFISHFRDGITELIDRIGAVRNALHREIGFRFPKVRVRDNQLLQPNGYSILIAGTPRGGGELHTDKLLAIGPESGLAALSQTIVADPVYGVPAAWIDPNQEHAAQLGGLTCHSFVSVLSTHLRQVILRSLREVYNYETTCQLLRDLSVSSPALYQEFYSGYSSRIRLHEVLLGLLSDGVCLEPIERIAEAAALASSDSISDLVDRVRIEIVNSMLKPCVNSIGQATRIELSKEIVQELPQIVRSEELLSRFRLAMIHLIQVTMAGKSLVLEVPCEFRKSISKLLGDYQPLLLVISTEEVLHSSLTWKTIPFSIDTLCGIASSTQQVQTDTQNMDTREQEV